MEFDKRDSEAARAAWLYYHEDLTQGDVARELGVSRSTVTRLLQRAKNDGLVQISLNVASSTFKAERDIERVYGVQKVRIVPDSADEATQKRWLGHVAGESLAEMVAEKSVVAVSWGTTMQAMADSLIGQRPVAGVEVVALIGGLHNASRGTNTYEVAKQIGQYFNAPVTALHAPVYVQDEATANGLISDPGIHEVLEIARHASVVVYSVGGLYDGMTMYRLGYISSEQREFLREHGAIGDIACRWIDGEGRPVALPASINPIGITLEELKAIPQRLAVAGGAEKHAAILGALRGGYVTHLVTDEGAAAFLLEHAEKDA